MAKRLQHQGHQTHFISHRRTPVISSPNTEFCVRASKLTFGKNTDLSVIGTNNSERCGGPISAADFGGSQRFNSRALASQGSSTSLSGFRNDQQQLVICRSLGIMGRKYFKKPQNVHQEDTKSNTQEEVSLTNEQTSPSRIPAQPINDSKLNVNKTPNPKTAFVTTEFGFKCGKTDAFYGKAYTGVAHGKALEKNIAEGARKHIIACQIAPAARRGCPAKQSYHALRDCVSPANKPPRHPRSEAANTSFTDNRTVTKPHISKLKLTKSTVTLSSASLGSSEIPKLPEVVGKVVHQTVKKPLHPVA